MSVRTFHAHVPAGMSADNHRVAAARVQLKLAAIAYESTRHGADASLLLCQAGLLTLCHAAIRYIEALSEQDLSGVRDPMTGGDDATARGRAHLNLAALAYVGARQGADSCQGFCSDGLAALCQAAIRYVEALRGGVSDRSASTPLLSEWDDRVEVTRSSARSSVRANR